MKAAPGSALWLLGHELRLAWYGAALNRGGRRRPSTAAIVVWIIGWLALHGVAFAMLRKADAATLASPFVAAAVSVGLAVCATFMLSTALKASVMALFERGDLDLLLSSPLPSRSIFVVRLLGVAAATATLYLYLFTPFAHVALAFGHPGWLGIYVVIGALALLMSCAAMLLTLALVRTLGARRTRTIAQVVAAVAGALLFLLSQASNLAAHGGWPGFAAAALKRLSAHGMLGPAGLLWLPGRAASGEALPLLGAAVLAGLAFTLTVARTHRFFVHGLQQAASTGRVAARPAGALRLRFRSSLFDTIVVKEWRLIARDPHLISQVLLQLVYLLPMFLLILRDSASGPAIGAGLTLLCSSLTGGLAWIVISAEDAPDLLLSAPVPLRTVRLAKLAAATMPALMLVALPLLWMVIRAPLAGVLAAFTTTGAVLGAGLIVLFAGRPAPRSDFKMRGKENFLCSMLEVVNTLCWGALGWLLVALAARSGDDVGWLLAGSAGALAGALLVPLLAWAFRRRV